MALGHSLSRTLVTEHPRRRKTTAGVLRPHAAAVEPVARHGAAPTTTLSTQDRAVAGDRARAHAWARGVPIDGILGMN